MPWKECDAMEQRMRMIMDYQTGDYTVTQLSERYDVTRKTIYKRINRYKAEGVDALADRSRAPHNHPNAVSEEIIEAIIACRTQHPTFGAKKVLARLKRLAPQTNWPARSTIAEILRRNGLVSDSPKRRRTPPYSDPLAHCDGPNRVWGLDHMGWFATGDGAKCEPLTLTDGFTRYLFRCQIVPNKGLLATQAVLTAVFGEYGLPDAIRSDNGSPFASRGIGGLSRLSVWLMRLGVTPERIEPGRPDQNGRHERMHQTVKHATARPPQPTLRRQQRAFDSFRREYNYDRPHEALGMATPADVYRPSPRPMPSRLPEPEYPCGLVTRMVQHRGEFHWRGERVFLGEALSGQRIGLEAISDRYWLVYFCRTLLGVFDSRTNSVLTGKRAESAIDSAGVTAPPRGPSAALQGLWAEHSIGRKVYTMSLD